jgi:hypothetical protein
MIESLPGTIQIHCLKSRTLFCIQITDLHKSQIQTLVSEDSARKHPAINQRILTWARITCTQEFLLCSFVCPKQRRLLIVIHHIVHFHQPAEVISILGGHKITSVIQLYVRTVVLNHVEKIVEKLIDDYAFVFFGRVVGELGIDPGKGVNGFLSKSCHLSF